MQKLILKLWLNNDKNNNMIELKVNFYSKLSNQISNIN